MKSNKPFVSSEAVIQLLDPVRIYTAKELAVMPLSVMNTAIEAQEAYFIMEQSTKMGGQAIAIRRQLQNGAKLIQIKEKSRTRYKIGNEYVEPRLIRQLEKRGLVKLDGGVKS
ncbi:hypothetical protein [Acinetobacter faecalis]|uniref:hypothetical protein n=1 Tax=Acinetobacter faecalis TaxID=2665161 RepID=UPI002A91A211|nr:hypothetical protein [Acinetobacter faecalis]MDY6450688.1 hypothetical protein [Acinetobacter faecalis]